MYMKTRQHEQGFTIIEVVVSVLIIMVALIPMMGLFTGSQDNYGRAAKKTTAVNLAQEKLEELKNQQAKSIVDNPANWIDFSGAPDYQYQVERTKVNHDLQLYKIEVRVQHKQLGNKSLVSLSTYSTNR